MMKLFDGKEYDEGVIKEKFPNLYDYVKTNGFYEEKVFKKDVYPYRLPLGILLCVVLFIEIVLSVRIFSKTFPFVMDKLLLILFGLWSVVTLHIITASFYYGLHYLSWPKEIPVGIVRINDGHIDFYFLGSSYYVGDLGKWSIHRRSFTGGSCGFFFFSLKRYFTLNKLGTRSSIALGLDSTHYQIIDDYLALRCGCLTAEKT